MQKQTNMNFNHLILPKKIFNALQKHRDQQKKLVLTYNLFPLSNIYLNNPRSKINKKYCSNICLIAENKFKLKFKLKKINKKLIFL